jgi:hypothetical protein
MNRIVASLFLAGLLVSCAHHRDVRPGTDGINRVIVYSDDDEKGARNAISQAEHYCKERDQSAAFVTEEKKYTGDMDESDYRTGKKIAKAAQTVGSAVYVFGGHRERNAGGIVGLGGAVGDQVLGKGYTVDMKFKCQ